MASRRQVVLALGAGTLCAPLGGWTQTPHKIYRIGFLSQAFPKDFFADFGAALRALGYEEGRNVEFVYRLAEGDNSRLAALAADLVAKKVDLIVAIQNTDILAAIRATSSIPIVMVFSIAPVETGMVASLARPGGNVTGMTLQSPQHGGKLLEVLRDAVPRLTRATYIWEPDFPGMALYRDELLRVGEAMKIRLTGVVVRTLSDLEIAFTLIARDRPDGLYVVPTGAIFTHRGRIIEFAARQRFPAIYPASQYVAEGGLISYAADRKAVMRRATTFVDRILKGANPSELPVERPNTYELAINMKTAKALGLMIPQAVQMRADRVIE